MRIQAVKTDVFAIPPRRPLGDSIHQITAFETVVTRIRTDDGFEGVGWTYTLGDGGMAIKSFLDSALTPLAIGQNPLDTESLWDRLWHGVHYLGSSGFTTHAIAAIDIACWDIRGKATGTPLSRLVGGRRTSLPAYGSGIDLAFSEADLIAEMRAFTTMGLGAVKMKLGKDDWSEDLRRIRAIRETIGPDVFLMVDANQKWSVAEAMARAPALADQGVFWLEEPILADDHAGYERLARACPVPLAAGETHYTRFQFQDLLQRGAIQFVQADVCRVGGITEWLKIAHVAESYNVAMAPHFVEELHHQLACGIANGIYVEHLADACLANAGVLEDPVRVDNGNFRPRQDPGHGIRFNWSTLDRYRIT